MSMRTTKDTLESSVPKTYAHPLASIKRRNFKKTLDQLKKQVINTGNSRKKKGIEDAYSPLFGGVGGVFSDNQADQISNQFVLIDDDVKKILELMSTIVEKTYESHTRNVKVQSNLISAAVASSYAGMPSSSLTSSATVPGSMSLSSSHSQPGGGKRKQTSVSVYTQTSTSACMSSQHAHGQLLPAIKNDLSQNVQQQTFAELRNLRSKYADLSSKHSLALNVLEKCKSSNRVYANALQEVLPLLSTRKCSSSQRSSLSELVSSSQEHLSAFADMEYDAADASKIVAENRDMMLLFQDNQLLWKKVQDLNQGFQSQRTARQLDPYTVDSARPQQSKNARMEVCDDSGGKQRKRKKKDEQ